MSRPIPPSSRASRRAKQAVIAAVGLLVASLALVTPTTASADGGRTGSRTTVDFDITGFRCEQQIITTTSRPDGTTVVHSRESGRTEASIALMTGTLSVETTVVFRPNGNGRIFGTWTMEPDASTGTVKGRLSGRVQGDDRSLIRSVGYGQASLRGVRVRMVTTTPGPTDDPPCDADPDVALAFTGNGTASAGPDRAPVGAVVVGSTKDFATTVADLTGAIEANPNLGLVRTVDHQAAAAGRDLVLAPTTELFFGNPNIGTPLMQSAQRTGIDLPQKMLIWEDLLGTVRVAYNAPAYLQSRHGITGADPQLQAVTNALAALAGAATGVQVEPVFDAGTVSRDKGLVMIRSERSAADALAAIVAALEAAPPVNVAFVLEHDANAARVGLELRPTKLVVFGNPSLGTGLMQTDQSAALDLPQKILIYEDEAGHTVIVYNDPEYVARRHGLKDQDQVLAVLAGALANFASAGT